MEMPWDEGEETKQEFDYVIVGAGPSAMGLLLGLVEPFVDGSEDETKKSFPFTVAVVERGPQEIKTDNHTLADLNHWFQASHDPLSSYVSLLMTSLKQTGRRVDVPIGRGIGGGSNINAGFCIAPPTEDFNDWPEPLKTKLPASIQHLQNHLATNQCIWNGTTRTEIKPQEAQADNAVPCLARRNAREDKTPSFQRMNYYEALIQHLKIKDHPLIDWFCNTEAQRILFEDNRASGVEVMTANGGFRSIYARKEVILCAGAIETPVLLLVSGVGPKADETTTTPTNTVSAVVQGVGRSARDHVILPRVLLVPPASITSLNGVHRLTSFEVKGDKFLLMTTTTTPGIALHYFTRILHHYWVWLFPPTTNHYAQWLWTILEVILKCLVLYTPIYFLMKYGLTTMNLALVNPKSTGTVQVKRKPGAKSTTRRRKDFDVELDLGYLSNPQDVNALWQGWVASAAADGNNWEWREVYPGFVIKGLLAMTTSSSSSSSSKQRTPTWFSAFARDNSLPFFHWCGTCAMITTGEGNNEKDWVVDARACVKSIQSLRICDASIFVNNLSVPPALTSAALGHALASIILQDGRTS